MQPIPARRRPARPRAEDRPSWGDHLRLVPSCDGTAARGRFDPVRADPPRVEPPACPAHADGDAVLGRARRLHPSSRAAPLQVLPRGIAGRHDDAIVLVLPDEAVKRLTQLLVVLLRLAPGPRDAMDPGAELICLVQQRAEVVERQPGEPLSPPLLAL